GLMLDRESAARDGRRFQTRLRAARLRETSACMEDVDYRAPRKLHRALAQSLQDGAWISRHRSILITGPCGVGKSWLACALDHEACRQGKVTLYFRMPRLFGELATARGDGSFERVFREIVHADAILDRLVHQAPRIEFDGPSMRKDPRPEPVVEAGETTQ
ncbi:ATP-binding protein, partial [Roseovarius sp. D22-M7]|uniref:ATP-binding protein n=1 Tax=Roseovarius sp. D22-M7 TaxID=3127116 RepID=UPI00300FDC83